jgi:hypothetical protein
MISPLAGGRHRAWSALSAVCICQLHPDSSSNRMIQVVGTSMLKHFTDAGAWPTKPGCATLPFFGVQPVLLTEKGEEIKERPAQGALRAAGHC